MHEHTHTELSHEADHAFADRFGFYRLQLWWIDRFTIHHGNFYRFSIVGRNDMRAGEVMIWRIPEIAGRPYAFALKLIVA